MEHHDKDLRQDETSTKPSISPFSMERVSEKSLLCFTCLVSHVFSCLSMASNLELRHDFIGPLFLVDDFF